MMNTRQIAALARQLMNLHGLQSWGFEYDRAKRRAGCCKHRKKLITLSAYYATKNADKDDDIKDTILHEIAHALAGARKGHGPEWKAVCRRIGARPVRCYNSDIIDMPKGRWQAKCGKCNELYTRHRRPKYTTGYYCRKCGPITGKLSYAWAS